MWLHKQVYREYLENDSNSQLGPSISVITIKMCFFWALNNEKIILFKGWTRCLCTGLNYAEKAVWENESFWVALFAILITLHCPLLEKVGLALNEQIQVFNVHNLVILLICSFKATIMAKIFETLGKIPEILKPQEILFLQ